LKCYSLFRGIGGFDLACRNLNIEIVGGCEIDKYANQVYQKQFGEKPYELDATKIKPEELPDFDLLCAGFPCQTFSIAGKRLGFEESRGTLFFEIARIAREKRPRLLLLENVKGLLSHDRGKTFANILATLADIGYDAEWQVLNSKYWVPQKRERIFIIGYLRGTPRPEIFPSIESPGKIAKEGKDRQVSQAIDSNYWKGLDNHGQRTMVVEDSIDEVHAQVNRDRYKNEPESDDRTLIAWSKSHRTGRSKHDKNRHNYGQIEERINTGEANTLNTGDGCRHMSTANYVTEYKTIRKLTPLECERLQGFPDNWTKGISDTQRYKCLGNAVTVPVVEFILSRLIN